MGKKPRLRFLPSSVGTHFALITTTSLVVVLALVFAELTASERTRSLEARQSAGQVVTALFAATSSAALVFDDSDALHKEIANVETTPGVVGAALFREGESVPAAASATLGACAHLAAGAVAVSGDRIAVARVIAGNDGHPVGRACILFSLDDDNRAFRANQWRMATRGVITALAIAALIILLSRQRVIRPLLRLVDMATSIERGETRASARIDRGDEIGLLARAFDRMGEAVADREGRLRAELDVAAHLQVSVLPKTLTVQGLEIAAVMETATEVGGDYYDVIPVDDGCWFGIGDVSGHGLGSGVVMLMIQSAVGALVRENPKASPRDVECVVNRLVHENVRLRMGRRDHATLTLLKYDASGAVSLAGAHEDILVFRAKSGTIENIETPGTWVGVTAAIEMATETTTLNLEAGDVMVLYTDGLTEAFRDGSQFGIERLGEAIRRNGTASVEDIRDAIMGDVKAWSGGVVHDDMSLVVIRHVGRDGAAAFAAPSAIAAPHDHDRHEEHVFRENV